MELTKREQATLNSYDRSIISAKRVKKNYIKNIDKKRKHIQNFKLAINQILKKMQYDFIFSRKLHTHSFQSLVRYIQHNMKISDDIYTKVMTVALPKFKHFKVGRIPNPLPKVNAKKNWDDFYRYETYGLNHYIQYLKGYINYDELHFAPYSCDSKFAHLAKPQNYHQQTKVLRKLHKVLKQHPTYQDMNAIVSFLVNLNYYDKDGNQMSTGSQLMSNNDLQSRSFLLRELSHDFINLGLSIPNINDTSSYSKSTLSALNKMIKQIKLLNKSKYNYEFAFLVNDPFLINNSMDMSKSAMIIRPMLELDENRYHEYSLTMLNAKKLRKVITATLKMCKGGMKAREKALNDISNILTFDIHPDITPMAYHGRYIFKSNKA